jgi:phospholipid/cholesterol/gamma-HCH transport system ATP-binding protein
VILYDEPTAGLDPINTCLVTRLILKLKAKQVTQIVVTHDLQTAERVANSVLMIQRGRVVFEGTPEALKQSHDPAVRAFIDPDCLSAHEQEAAGLTRPITQPE